MQPLTAKPFYPGLDALRGIAVLSVVLFHYFPNVAFLSWGWMGVDLFFVISGFLITSILLRADKKEKTFFRNFYARRLLRIVPLCFLILLVFFIVVLVFDHLDRFAFYKENWWYYFLFLENWLFVFKGLPYEYHLNHFWSLAVEEQFYLFFPLLVYFLSLRNLTRLILFLLPLIFCLRTAAWYFYPDQLPIYYCNTFTRIDTILIGSLLACGYKIQKPRLALTFAIAGFFLLLSGILYFRSAAITHPVMATIGYSLIAVTAYFFLSFYTQTNHTLLFVRGNRVLNYVGKISYGIYLFHLPMLLAVRSIAVKMAGENATPFLVAAVSLSLTLALSSVSFSTMESWFLRRKVYFPVKTTDHSTQPSILSPSSQD